MEASTITSLGTWKLEMPLAESTIGEFRPVRVAGVQVLDNFLALRSRQ
jgi:hypothetical protein